MARARKVVSDQSSQEFSELRRQFNNLLLVIEAATTLADVQAAITAGTDVISGRELNGVRPTPTHPRRPRDLGTELMDDSSDY